jgi:hypothetical protein
MLATSPFLSRFGARQGRGINTIARHGRRFTAVDAVDRDLTGPRRSREMAEVQRALQAQKVCQTSHGHAEEEYERRIDDE